MHYLMIMRSFLMFVVLSCLGCTSVSAAQPDTTARWRKGNLHTHSFWSDGDDFPEMIVRWYKAQKYDFLAISDHNVLHQSERWLPVGTNQLQNEALSKYLASFGTNWVEVRGDDAKREVRLKELSEYRGLFEEPGEFLLIQSEEISDAFGKLPIHINASNLKDLIKPQGGKSVREVMQNNVNAILDQGRKSGEPILPHLNHPNFHWAVTAEDLAAVEGERFFEVYNGHPSVNNQGNSQHAGTDAIWDVALALRLTSSNPEPLYAVATDDTHNYHRHGLGQSNAGRGWIMVWAQSLSPEELLEAMERGDFYASSGVRLKEVRRSAGELSVEVDPEPGVEYKVEFIGTPKNFSRHGEAVKDSDGKELYTTRRYGPEVGRVMAESVGLRATCTLKDRELYVRARIVSSKVKANPSEAGEKEMAWTQPVFNVAIKE